MSSCPGCLLDVVFSCSVFAREMLSLTVLLLVRPPAATVLLTKLCNPYSINSIRYRLVQQADRRTVKWVCGWSYYLLYYLQVRPRDVPLSAWTGTSVPRRSRHSSRRSRISASATFRQPTPAHCASLSTQHIRPSPGFSGRWSDGLELTAAR